MSTTNIGAILGKIGCQFRSNIESHIIDNRLQKGDDVEWLLELLTEISHPADIVLDAFKTSTFWEFSYHLYFHLKNAISIYIPFDKDVVWPRPIRKEGNIIRFDDIDAEDKPKPKPFDKSMIIKDDLKPLASMAIPSIWDEMIVLFTELGIWQAVLLNETTALFPKGWHAYYLEKIYVFSMNDMQEIIDCPKRDKCNFDNEKLEVFKTQDIMPSVKIDGDKAVASFYYWDEWSGFCRLSIPIERNGQLVVFGKEEREVLVKYDCGLRF